MTKSSRPTPGGWLTGTPPRSTTPFHDPDPCDQGTDAARNAVASGAPALPHLMTPRQVAALFHVSERTIRNWRREGRLTPVPITARTVLYRYEDVIDLIDRSDA